MADRAKYERALLTHAPGDWDENDIGIAADDLEGDWDRLDRGLIAHSLWRMGVTPEHPGKCRAGEDYSTYENECHPCQERLLTIADAVLADMAADHVLRAPWDSETGCFGHCDPEGWAECTNRTILHEEEEFAPGECDGSGTCSAPVHVHGCYTPHRSDQCDSPEEYGHTDRTIGASDE